jgi:hypothetical protein
MLRPRRRWRRCRAIIGWSCLIRLIVVLTGLAQPARDWRAGTRLARWHWRWWRRWQRYRTCPTRRNGWSRFRSGWWLVPAAGFFPSGRIGRTYLGNGRGTRSLGLGLTGRLGFHLADGFFECEALAGNVRLVQCRGDTAQLRNQSRACALVKHAAGIAGVVFQAGNGTGNERIVICHRYSVYSFRRPEFSCFKSQTGCSQG